MNLTERKLYLNGDGAGSSNLINVNDYFHMFYIRFV